jgi:hypothetical protein
MLKRILLILIVVVLIGIGFGLYEWFKPKTNYANATADVTISADSLFNAFSKNEKRADSLYLNKVIQVKGVVSQISENQNNEKNLVLQTADPMYGISCTMYKNDSLNYKKIKSGDKTTIKGFCTGFTTDVVITNSSIVK